VFHVYSFARGQLFSQKHDMKQKCTHGRGKGKCREI